MKQYTHPIWTIVSIKHDIITESTSISPLQFNNSGAAELGLGEFAPTREMD